MFAIGMTLIMLASLASAASESLLGLLLSRMAQGLGSAMLMCLFGGLVRNIYPLNKLGMGISLNAMTVGSMAVLGPTIGAFILQFARSAERRDGQKAVDTRRSGWSPFH